MPFPKIPSYGIPPAGISTGTLKNFWIFSSHSPPIRETWFSSCGGHGYELDFDAMKKRHFRETFERMLDKVACDDSVIKCTNAEAIRAHFGIDQQAKQQTRQKAATPASEEGKEAEL